MRPPLSVDEVFEGLKSDIVVEAGELRINLGLTQAEVARRMGTHQAKVARIEHGQENLRLETLARLAVALETMVFVAFDTPTDMYPKQRRVRQLPFSD